MLKHKQLEVRSAHSHYSKGRVTDSQKSYIWCVADIFNFKHSCLITEYRNTVK